MTTGAGADGGLVFDNFCYASPGSEHGDGSNFGLADGSVHYFIDTMDPNVFILLGSMADGQPVNLKDERDRSRRVGRAQRAPPRNFHDLGGARFARPTLPAQRDRRRRQA